jgi:hypothetical protein
VNVVALAPDLADRARIELMAPGARFVGVAAQLPAAAEGAEVVVVDLTRAGVLDVLDEVVAVAARVIGYGPHVASELLAAATAAGVEAVPRSRFFGGREPFIARKQS